MNNCNFVGRLAADPEIRDVGSTKLATFSLAVEEYRKDKEGNKKKRVDFFEFEAWDTAALAIEKYAEEGALMLVESSARNYQNAEVIETYFRVNSFKILH